METQQRFALDSNIANALLEGCVRLSVQRDAAGEVVGYRVLEMNSKAAQVSGLREQEAIGRSVCEVLAMDEDCWRKLRDFFQTAKGASSFEYRFGQFDRRFLVSPVHLSEDEILLFFVEITYRRRAEEALRIHEILFEKAQDIILYINTEGKVVDANQKACDLYGYSKERLLSMKIQDIRHPDTQEEYERQMYQAEAGGVVFESRHFRADGSEFPVEVSARSTYTDQGKLRIHIIRDITERKEHEAKIAWLVRHDSLTGILNRTSFVTELEEEIQRAQRGKSQFALLLFDIDQFKRINDNYGHATGDHVLKWVAKKVQSILRVTDHIGRLGGDEFMVLQTNVKKRQDVLTLIDRMRECLQAPISYGEESLNISVSIGVAVFPQPIMGADDLLHFADQAMYQAKHGGGDGYAFYSAADTP